MQFILKDYTGQVSVNKETGKETELYKTLGYFTDIRSALNHFLKMKVMESTASTLYELRQDILQLKMGIESLFSLQLSTEPTEAENEE
jgi:hypothetical protein